MHSCSGFSWENPQKVRYHEHRCRNVLLRSISPINILIITEPTCLSDCIPVDDTFGTAARRKHFCLYENHRTKKMKQTGSECIVHILSGLQTTASCPWLNVSKHITAAHSHTHMERVFFEDTHRISRRQWRRSVRLFQSFMEFDHRSGSVTWHQAVRCCRKLFRFKLSRESSAGTDVICSFFVFFSCDLLWFLWRGGEGRGGGGTKKTRCSHVWSYTCCKRPFMAFWTAAAPHRHFSPLSFC